MNCESCGHPLIDHGDYPEEQCDCCSGRLWLKVNDKKEELVNTGRGRIPRKFVVCEEFPDYAVSKTGAVIHIETGRLCTFFRLRADGQAIIGLRRNGKTYPRSVQELRAKAFPNRITPLEELANSLPTKEKIDGTERSR